MYRKNKNPFQGLLRPLTPFVARLTLWPLVLDAVSGLSSFDASLCRLSRASSSARLCLVIRCTIQFEPRVFRGA